MDIDVLIEAEAWDALDLQAIAEKVAHAAFTELDLAPEGFSLSLLAADDARIATLNAEFRGKPTPTNVLSWPSEDRAAATPGAIPELPKADLSRPPVEVGDIALAYETCAREAEEGGKPLAHHVTHLILHGLLHCLGFDHENDPDAALMESLETRVLATLGVPDPY
ncbi:rRNA maturation RNase YbeY [Rhodobacterales bacterium HKCCE4037]|nr:rRNA maturation RNase YbeY [Rhodobacterales bacterium HKCCE4037]